MESQVVVLGAGIIGLQIAIKLLESSFNVVVLAKDLPGDRSPDYTSPQAGAHWRTHSSPDNEEQCRWDIETYNHWLEVIEGEENEATPFVERSGLTLIPSVLYWDSARHHELRNGEADSLWFAKYVRDFRVLKEDLPPGVAVGATFTSVAVNVPQHLSYLLRRAKHLGAVIVRGSLPFNEEPKAVFKSAEELIRTHVAPSEELSRGSTNLPVFAYVNATGINAGKIFGDDQVFPVRGQTAIVRGETTRITTRHGYDDGCREPTISYAIPRVGTNTTVLGGSKSSGDWNTNVETSLTGEILERCQTICSEILVDKDGSGLRFDLLSSAVGLRPARVGGARVEKETTSRDVGARAIVHAYGHAGAGYQNCVGVANKVLRLLQQE